MLENHNFAFHQILFSSEKYYVFFKYTHNRVSFEDRIILLNICVNKLLTLLRINYLLHIEAQSSRVVVNHKVINITVFIICISIIDLFPCSIFTNSTKILKTFVNKEIKTKK